MAAGSQVYYDSSCRRKPEVAQVCDCLSVNAEVMPSRHLLSHIQQDCILPVFRNIYACPEAVVAADLHPSALC